MNRVGEGERGGGRRGFGVEAFKPGVAQEVATRGAAEQGHAQRLGQLMAHGGHPVARHDDGYAHPGRLDHHFAGEPPGGVEHLVSPLHAVHRHPPGDGVDGVVAADVFDKALQRVAVKQRAAVHRSGLAVHAVAQLHLVEQADQRGLAQARGLRVGQAGLAQLRHRVAKDRTLPAAGGDDAARDAGFEVADAVAGAHRRGLHRPVHIDAVDLARLLDQTLIEQVAEHQQFGIRAQSHQRDQLAFVEVDRQRTFGRDVDLPMLAMLIEYPDRPHDLAARPAEAGRVGPTRQRHGLEGGWRYGLQSG